MSGDEDSTEARPAVVNITCPSCGGSVPGADLGEKATCKYCGTELHVPDVQLPADEEPAPPSEHEAEPEPSPRSAPQGRAQLGIVLAMLGVFVLFALWLVSSKPEPSAPPSTPVVIEPPTRARDPEMAGIDCSIACTKPCLEIKEPQSLIDCMDKCDAKCKHVGKGTRAQCIGRCGDKCRGAPDPTTLAACESGCASSCPPN